MYVLPDNRGQPRPSQQSGMCLAILLVVYLLVYNITSTLLGPSNGGSTEIIRLLRLLVPLLPLSPISFPLPSPSDRALIMPRPMSGHVRCEFSVTGYESTAHSNQGSWRADYYYSKRLDQSRNSSAVMSCNSSESSS